VWPLESGANSKSRAEVIALQETGKTIYVFLAINKTTVRRRSYSGADAKAYENGCGSSLGGGRIQGKELIPIIQNPL